MFRMCLGINNVASEGETGFRTRNHPLALLYIKDRTSYNIELSAYTIGYSLPLIQSNFIQ